MILSLSQSIPLSWLFLAEVWIVLLWYRHGSQAGSSFVRRLDQLLVLLVPEVGLSGRRPTAASRQDAIRVLARYRTLAGLRRAAWRWRVQLRAVSAQGYQVAAEILSSPGEVAHGRELVQEAVEALKLERASGGSSLPSGADPVVVLAYGLGAWPSGADLTSLEQLLGELGVSQAELRNRFDGLIRTIATANQTREFRELAGASFVLGASSRIVEAAAPPGKSVPPPGWFAALKGHLR